MFLYIIAYEEGFHALCFAIQGINWETLTKWRYVAMIKLIKRIIYLIKSEKNWADRTSDAPKAFKTGG